MLILWKLKKKRHGRKQRAAVFRYSVQIHCSFAVLADWVRQVLALHNGREARAPQTNTQRTCPHREHDKTASALMNSSVVPAASHKSFNNGFQRPWMLG